MRVLPCGEAAWLVECADLAETQRTARALEGLAGIEELVPAARTVLVRTTPDHLTTVRASLDDVTLPSASESAAEAEPVTVPVRYDGPDLDEVGRLTGLGRDGVVSAHTETRWQVAFSGFAPGFGYLVPVDPDDTRLHVARRKEPRTRVPAGAVGLAGEFSGCYPRESPGGWQLIGTTEALLWDPDRDPPAMLVPGCHVRFEAT